MAEESNDNGGKPTRQYRLLECFGRHHDGLQPRAALINKHDSELVNTGLAFVRANVVPARFCLVCLRGENEPQFEAVISGRRAAQNL